MRKFKIHGINNQAWETEAVKYTLDSGFFHFIGRGSAQVLAVKADLVKSITSTDAEQA